MRVGANVIDEVRDNVRQVSDHHTTTQCSSHYTHQTTARAQLHHSEGGEEEREGRRQRAQVVAQEVRSRPQLEGDATRWSEEEVDGQAVVVGRRVGRGGVRNEGSGDVITGMRRRRGRRGRSGSCPFFVEACKDTTVTSNPLVCILVG